MGTLSLPKISSQSKRVQRMKAWRPDLFSNPVPLARGFMHEPGDWPLGMMERRRFFFHWCNSPEYHRAILAADQRIGLWGATQDITVAEREHARHCLAFGPDARGVYRGVMS